MWWDRERDRGRDREWDRGQHREWDRVKTGSETGDNTGSETGSERGTERGSETGSETRYLVKLSLPDIFLNGAKRPHCCSCASIYLNVDIHIDWDKKNKISLNSCMQVIVTFSHFQKEKLPGQSYSIGKQEINICLEPISERRMSKSFHEPSVKLVRIDVIGSLGFSLNGAELSVDSGNSENLRNHWGMNWV